MKRTNDDKQQAPVPYRLPPARLPTPSQKLPAGRWPALLLILLSLALLGCGLAEGVRKFAEPIDKNGCMTDCEREGMEFGSYVYESHTCRCLDVDGNTVDLYGLDGGE